MDQFRKRTTNRSAILREIHFAGPLGRAELSRRLNIRKSSVTSIASELVNRGVVAEETPDRTRSRLSLNVAGKCVVVGYLSVGRIHVGRVMLDGELAHERTVPFDVAAPVSEILRLLGDVLHEELERVRHNVLGVGVAVIGGVDPNTGVTTFAANLHQWKNVPARQYLEERLKVGVLVDNDCRSQLWGTAWFDRHLRDSSNILFVGLMESGVSGALTVRGRMISGSKLGAGDFGHVRAGDEGRICSCGKLDCLETYASSPAIIREIVRVRPDRASISTAGEVAQLAAEDRVVMNTLDRLIARVAGILTPILAALDPESLLLGTPDPALSRILCDLLRRRLEVELMGLGSHKVQLIIAHADTRATLRGIAGLVIDRCFRSGNLELPMQGAASALLVSASAVHLA